MNFKNPLGKTLIYGKHAVLAALQNSLRSVHKIYLTQDNFSLIEHYKELYDKVQLVLPKDFRHLLPDVKAHQNILLISNQLHTTITDLNLTKKVSLIVCLDQITDPNNIGAILRSAAAFKADALIMTKNNAPQNFSSIYKVSSGAAEIVPIIQVTNLTDTINYLQKSNYWAVGLDINAKYLLGEQKLPEKTIIVLGSENKGIRKLVKENCDLLYKIPMASVIDSLNVSNSGAIALYEYYKLYHSLLS